jgi:thiamine biosynthesis lipoprotein
MRDLRCRAHSKSFLYIFLWSFLSIALVCLAGGEDSVNGSVVQFSGTTMGTTYSVKIVDFPKAIDRQQLTAEIAHVLDKVNKSMSTYLQDSEIMRFNRASTTDWVRVSTDLLEVLEQSLYWNTRTGGAFDVTVGALVNLWGFGPEWTTAQIPPDSRIKRALENVGRGLLQVRRSPPAIRKERENVFVDLSGIAKGYAVDKLIELLIVSGIDNGLVEIGGELKAIGQNAYRRPWMVAIERSPGQGSLGTVINCSDRAVATSGDYRNFFQKNGRRYSHTIDPRIGRTADRDLASATVVHSSAAAADALATALMVMGAEEAYKFAVREEIDASFLIRKGNDLRERFTPRFKSLLANVE